jgi:hypothetical protein
MSGAVVRSTLFLFIVSLQLGVFDDLLVDGDELGMSLHPVKTFLELDERVNEFGEEDVSGGDVVGGDEFGVALDDPLFQGSEVVRNGVFEEGIDVILGLFTVTHLDLFAVEFHQVVDDLGDVGFIDESLALGFAQRSSETEDGRSLSDGVAGSSDEGGEVGKGEDLLDLLLGAIFFVPVHDTFVIELDFVENEGSTDGRSQTADRPVVESELFGGHYLWSF